MMTVNHARDFMERMKLCKIKATMESVFEIKGYMLGFAICYGRAFTTAGKQRPSLKPNQVFGENNPLIAVHNDIIHMRDKKYAHTDDNDHTASKIEFEMDGEDVVIVPRIALGIPGYAFKNYEEALNTLENFVATKLFEMLEKASTRLGRRVKFPDGPVPHWVEVAQ